MPYGKNYNYSIRDASGNKMRCEGIVLIWIKPEGGENTLIEALVSSTLTDDLLLLCGDMKRMNMLHPEFPKPIIMAT